MGLRQLTRLPPDGQRLAGKRELKVHANRRRSR